MIQRFRDALALFECCSQPVKCNLFHSSERVGRVSLRSQRNQETREFLLYMNRQLRAQLPAHRASLKSLPVPFYSPLSFLVFSSSPKKSSQAAASASSAFRTTFERQPKHPRCYASELEKPDEGSDRSPQIARVRSQCADAGLHSSLGFGRSPAFCWEFQAAPRSRHNLSSLFRSIVLYAISHVNQYLKRSG